MTEHKANFFLVEGEIGAGKTELATALAAKLRENGASVCLILEPVGEWKRVGILQQFYGNPARFGYSFQTYVFATRILAIVNAIAAHPDADTYILERSPLTDIIFMELQRDILLPLEMEMYKTWCESWRTFCPVDFDRAYVIYLQTDLETCMARVSSRAREGELVVAEVKTATAAGGVSIEYQALLRRAHQAYFLGRGREAFPHMPPCPIQTAIIEVSPQLANGNFRDPGPERDAILGTIMRKMTLSIEIATLQRQFTVLKQEYAELLRRGDVSDDDVSDDMADDAAK